MSISKNVDMRKTLNLSKNLKSANMAEDIDLYDDLPVLNIGESISKIEEERQYFKDQLKEKESFLQQIQEKIEILEKEKKILEKNISSLYKTAVEELKRKDKTIADLHREKDSIIFRRRGKQNVTDNSPHPCRMLAQDNLHSEVHLPCNTRKVVPSNEQYSESQKSVTVIPLSRCSSSKIKIEQPLQEKFAHIETSLDVRDSVSKAHFLENKSLDPLSQSQEEKIPKSERPSRSLPSEVERERVYKQNSFHEYSSRSSRRKSISPHNRYRYSGSSRKPGSQERNISPNRKYRGERFWRNSTKEQVKVVNSCHDKEKHVRSKPSTGIPRKNFHSPRKRGMDIRYDKPKFNKDNRIQSENVKLASELKSKYTKLSNERYTRSPMKRKNCLQQTSEFGENTSRKIHLSDFKSTSEENILKLSPDSEHLSDRSKSKTGTNVEDTSLYCNCQKIDCNRCKESKMFHSLEDKRKGLTRNSLSQVESKLRNSVSDVTLTPQVVMENKMNTSTENKNNVATKSIQNLKDAKYLEDKVSFLENMELNSVVTVHSHNTCENIEGETSTLKLNMIHVSDTEQQPKQLLPLNSPIEKDRPESITDASCSFQAVPSRHFNSPPCMTLVPLKVSPSFEDPSIVKENKFSHCVFNEQFEFKRVRQKRFKKLHVTERSLQENLDISKQEKSDSLFNCISKKEVQMLGDNHTDVARSGIKLQNGEGNKNDGSCIKTLLDQEMTEEYNVCETVKDNLESNPKNSTELCDNNLHENKGSKRKLYSLCDGFKANPEKKSCVINPPKSNEIVVVQRFNDETNTLNVNDSLTSSDSVCGFDSVGKTNVGDVDDGQSTARLKTRIAIPSRRRRVINLQDNVTQVLSQVD